MTSGYSDAMCFIKLGVRRPKTAGFLLNSKDSKDKSE